MKFLNHNHPNGLFSLLKNHKNTVAKFGLFALIATVFSFSIWLNVFSQADLLLFSTFQLSQPLVVFFAAAFCLLEWIAGTSFLVSTHALWSKKADPKTDALVIYILSFSAILSVFWMLVFYPGIMSYDATLAWEQALKNQYDAWHPPILAMIMHLTQKLVNQPSLFASMQGFLFWSSLFYLLWQAIHHIRLFIISTFVIALIPQIWLYSNAAISNTSMTACVLLTCAFLIRSFRLKSQISFLAAIICLSLAICFRREAILLAVIPIGCVFYSVWKQSDSIQSNIQKLSQILPLVLILLIVPAKLIGMSPNVTGTSPASYVFLSQYVGTITRAGSRISESEAQAERQSIDERFGSGTFQLVMGEGFDCRFPRTWIRNIRLANKEKIILKESSFVMQKAASMAFRHPVAYIKHKACNFSYVLQIPEVVYQDWGGISTSRPISIRRRELNIELNSQIPFVQETYGRLMKWMLNAPIIQLTFKHYIFYTLSLLTLFIGIINHRMEWIIPALFSIVYAFGNLIPDSFPFWRYLFPCYTLAWVCLLGMLSYLAKKRLPNLF